MTTGRDLPWAWLFALPAIFLLALAAAAEPMEISGQLNPDQATEDGVIYAVFEVVTDQPTVMAVSSADGPLESITYFQTSSLVGFNAERDQIPDNLLIRGFQGEVTPRGLNGTWLFFVVASATYETVDFVAHFDNSISVKQLNPSDVEPFDLAAAFGQSGLDNSMSVRTASEELLSEMVASTYVRKQFLATYDLGLVDSQSELDETLEYIRELEEQVVSLTQALEDISGLAGSQDFLTEHLDLQIRILNSQISGQSPRASELLWRIEGMKKDLIQLREIDALQDHTGEYAQFLMRSFANEFFANNGEVSVRVTGISAHAAPHLDITLPAYVSLLGGLQEPIIEAPVIVEETTEADLGEIWNPDDWNGTAFIKRDDIFRATHRVMLNRSLLELAAVEKLGKESVITLGDASAILTTVLGDEGFADLSFQGIEKDGTGFILATGLEQTDAKGVPLEGELRHSNEVIKIKDRSLAGYLRALFTSEPGYFRAILFLVSAQQYTNEGPNADFRTMQLWSDESLKGRLPDAVAARLYTSNHEITALIYEFRKVAAPEFIDKTKSNIQASAHFTNTQTLKKHLLR